LIGEACKHLQIAQALKQVCKIFIAKVAVAQIDLGYIYCGWVCGEDFFEAHNLPQVELVLIDEKLLVINKAEGRDRVAKTLALMEVIIENLVHDIGL
jgi:hypothetical protein